MNRMRFVLTDKNSEVLKAYKTTEAKVECPLMMLFTGICSIAEIYQKLKGEKNEKIFIYNESTIMMIIKTGENQSKICKECINLAKK